MEVKVVSILLCAGKGERLGLGPKCFLKIGGRYIFEYSLHKLLKYSDFIVVTVPSKKYEKFFKSGKIIVIEGGKTRQESLIKAIERIKIEVKKMVLKNDFVIVEHDGARPLFSENLLLRVIETTRKFGSAVPFINPVETVRRIKRRMGRIILTDDKREEIAIVQTPQGYKFKDILRAIEIAKKKNFFSTDGAGLLRLTGKIYGIEGERTNIKITFKEDLKIAEALIKNKKLVN